MVRAMRDAIVMSPPLVITHAQIDQLVDTIAAALDDAGEALSKQEPDPKSGGGGWRGRSSQGG
jgi:hypothetical protein